PPHSGKIIHDQDFYLFVQGNPRPSTQLAFHMVTSLSSPSRRWHKR
ncbi:MAG: hypothetical protein ACI96P_002066, partial [Candidatus Azotimanducaceae bacterium]